MWSSFKQDWIDTIRLTAIIKFKILLYRKVPPEKRSKKEMALPHRTYLTCE